MLKLNEGGVRNRLYLPLDIGAKRRSTGTSAG
jgi:hypothetical protein